MTTITLTNSRSITIAMITPSVGTRTVSKQRGRATCRQAGSLATARGQKDQ